MQKFWGYISFSGTSTSHSLATNRNIILCNRLSIIVATLVTVIGLLQTFYYEFGLISIISLVCAALLLLPILINAAGHNRLSRLFLCIMLPVLVIAVSVIAKKLYPNNIGESFYYDYRYMLLGISVIAPILFGAAERNYLIAGSAFILMALILFDPIHIYFDVGYDQTNHQMRSYEFSGILAVIIFLLIIFCTITLKSIYDGFEKRNEELIEELTLQTDKLNDSQSKLQEANNVIRKQRELLLIQNQNLENQLDAKTKDLMDTNTELIKHNTELRQFSYTVSHNLRGPVASLLGLLRLFDPKTLQGENSTILEHSLSSINKLDAIISDLGKIIDIRNDIFRIRQQIDLQQEMDLLFQIFDKEIRSNNVLIRTDFSKSPLLYSVRPMVASILYNLISNGIKYRSAERNPEIEITSDQDETHFLLTVTDNGLGIDLQLHKENLFLMYKRFHPHTEGKGLGLYLIKLQTQALGGDVEVTSEINRFTQFRIRLRKPENVERQVLYEEDHAQIFFDARINATGVIWSGPITSSQYRSVFSKCLEFFKVYNTPNYLADLSYQGPVSREDQQWAFSDIMPEAARKGLRRIATVQSNFEYPEVAEYIHNINMTLKQFNIIQRSFTSREDAIRWIEEETNKATHTNGTDHRMG